MFPTTALSEPSAAPRTAPARPRVTLRDCINAIMIRDCARLAREFVDKPVRAGKFEAQLPAPAPRVKPAPQPDKPSKPPGDSALDKLNREIQQRQEEEDARAKARGEYTYWEKGILENAYTLTHCVHRQLDHCHDPKCTYHGKPDYRVRPWDHPASVMAPYIDTCGEYIFPSESSKDPTPPAAGS